MQEGNVLLFGIHLLCIDHLLFFLVRYFEAGTLLITSRVRHVYGYEVVAEAISDARRNAELNNIHNATFIQGDLNKINDKFGSDLPKADIVILGLFLLKTSSSWNCVQAFLIFHQEDILHEQLSCLLLQVISSILYWLNSALW